MPPPLISISPAPLAASLDELLTQAPLARLRAASLDELLTQAPLARLRAALPVDSAVRQPRIVLRDLAAGVIGILAAGAAAWVALSLGLLRERQDWRTAVVEYTNLYTAFLSPSLAAMITPAPHRLARMQGGDS